MGAVALLGRLMVALIFLTSGAQKLTSFSLSDGGPTMDIMVRSIICRTGPACNLRDRRTPSIGKHSVRLVTIIALCIAPQTGRILVLLCGVQAPKMDTFLTQIGHLVGQRISVPRVTWFTNCFGNCAKTKLSGRRNCETTAGAATCLSLSWHIIHVHL
jgi:uncharacterized membrane protein YphA (DoxX/SURF4 family)